MTDLRQTRLKIWNRVNEAIGAGDLDRANREMDALLNNIRPYLKNLDDGGEAEETLDKFLENLNGEYQKGVAAINEDTSDLKPLDRNEIRRVRYSKMAQYRTAELYSFLSELLYEKNLIPTGD